MIIWLLRHGKTKGNEEGRYIGATDEGLSPAGKEELLTGLLKGGYPEPDLLFVSPMKRCRETASCLFPKKPYILTEDFREISFGEFENKNCRELSHNPAYQAWIDSGGSLAFPGGEPLCEFKKRSAAAFLNAAGEAGKRKAAVMGVIAHGGTIMAVMEAFEGSGKDFYSWQTENGGGYVCNWENGILTVLTCIGKKNTPIQTLLSEKGNHIC